MFTTWGVPPVSPPMLTVRAPRGRLPPLPQPLSRRTATPCVPVPMGAAFTEIVVVAVLLPGMSTV